MIIPIDNYDMNCFTPITADLSGHLQLVGKYHSCIWLVIEG